MIDDWKENYWSIVLGLLALAAGLISVFKENFRGTGAIIVLILLVFISVDYYTRKINKNEEKIKELEHELDFIKKFHELENRVKILELNNPKKKRK